MAPNKYSVHFTHLRVQLDDVEFDLPVTGGEFLVEYDLDDYGTLQMKTPMTMSMEITSGELLAAMNRTHPKPPKFSSVKDADRWLDHHPSAT